MKTINTQIVCLGDSNTSFPNSAKSFNKLERNMIPDYASSYSYKLLKKFGSDTLLWQCGVWGSAMATEHPKTIWDKGEIPTMRYEMWEASWDLIKNRQYPEFYQNANNVKLASNAKFIYTFLFGTNDIYKWSQTKKSFKQKYIEIINKIHDDCVAIVMTAPPYWTRTYVGGGNYRYSMSNSFNSAIVNEMNPMIRSIPNAIILDIYPLLTDRKYYQDLVHLNELGHKVIADKLYSVIKNYLTGTSEPPIEEPEPSENDIVVGQLKTDIIDIQNTLSKMYSDLDKIND